MLAQIMLSNIEIRGKEIIGPADNINRGESQIEPEVKFYQHEVIAMAHPGTNFCRQEEMSVCTADCQKQQTSCSFYEKSQNADRCMYFIFDEFCDSLKAQINSTAAVTTSRY